MDGRDNNFGIDFAPIGQAIKKARIAQNMTREQLAGISADKDIREFRHTLCVGHGIFVNRQAA